MFSPYNFFFSHSRPCTTLDASYTPEVSNKQEQENSFGKREIVKRTGNIYQVTQKKILSISIQGMTCMNKTDYQLDCPSTHEQEPSPFPSLRKLSSIPFRDHLLLF